MNEMSVDPQQGAAAPFGDVSQELSALRYRTTVDDLFTRAVKRWSGSPFVIDSRTLTYGEMDGEVDRVASGLVALGVGPGDTVALWMSNIWEWVAVQFAVTRIGAVLVPINTRLRADDLAHVLANSGARVIVTQEGIGEFSYTSVLAELLAKEGCLPALEHAVIARSSAPRAAPFLDWDGFLKGGLGVARPKVDASPEDLAYILYTSGSTSLPKGVMLPHKSLNNAINLSGDYVEGDCIFAGFPLFAVTGCQNSVLVAIVIGGSIVLQERFQRDDALDLIEKHKCTVIAGITQILLDIAAAEGFSPQRVATLRSASIFPRRPEHIPLFDRFGITKATTGYGMTETSGPVANSSSLDEIGFEGREWPGDQIRLVAEDGNNPESGQPGAIHVKSPHMMLGYFDNPVATAAQFDEDGWFNTGDVGCRDEQGLLKWMGRNSDIIKSSGFNYAAQEVEAFLAEHADLEEVALIGVPDSNRGEVGIAYVVLGDGVSFDDGDLKRICADRIASYKVPREVIVIDDFPKTASGKIRKVELRQWYDEMKEKSHDK